MKNNNKKTTPAVSWPAKLADSPWPVAVLLLALALVTMWMLAIDGANYLRKIELLSYFAPTGMYLRECLANPGGLLVYVSTFLVQTFYHPGLGAAIYALALTGIALLSIPALGLRGYWRCLSVVVPSMVLLALVQLGYVIFSLKSPGNAFNLPLGMLAAFALVWAYRAVKPWWSRALLICVIVGVGYCVIGFYALLAGALCMAVELARLVRPVGARWTPVLPVVLGAIALWAVPKLWFCCIGGDMMIYRIYTYPLPMLLEGEEGLWTPYNIMFGVSALLALAMPLVPAAVSRSVWTGVLTVAVAVASMVCAVVGRVDDPNLRLTLDLDHALQQQQWDHALEIAAAAQDFAPTRVNVVLTDMALLRAGKLADNMFKYRSASAPYETARAERATHDILSRIFSYHTGLANYAYRWGMEYKVEYGTSVEQLQYMAKAALLNGDMALARKALYNLSLTAYHKDWADRYYPMLDNPELIDSDPELSSIKRIMTKDDVFINDNGRLEAYIWPYLTEHPNGTIESLELALCAALMQQNVYAFMQLIQNYAHRTDRLPVHFQEALLLCATVSETIDLSPFKIDPAVADRFEKYKQAVSMYSRYGEQREREMLVTSYGDTFWYYLSYVNKLLIY